MTRTFLTFFSSFILSPEFVVVVCAVLISTSVTVPDQWIVQNIGVKGEALKYLAFLPLGLGGWVLSESRKLLFPNSEINSTLHEWDGYPELKITVYVGLLYAALFSLLGIVPWLMGLEIKTFTELLIILTSVVGSIVVAATVYMARIDQDEIVEKMKKL